MPAQKKKSPVQARKRKVSKYKSFRLSKRIPHPAGPLPSAWQLLKKTGHMMWSNKWTLLKIVLIYIVLNLAFVRGFASPLNVDAVKTDLQQYVGGEASRADTTVAVLGRLLGGDQVSGSGSVYQVLLFIVFGLALIWVFRQWSAGNKPKAKEALYNGMYPLVPMLLVLVLLVVQLAPALLGSAIYSATVSSGVAVTGYEKAVWILLCLSLVVLSLYLIFSSLFALYVVTLPEMTPLKALRSSRQLVFARRVNVMLKLLVIPLVFLLVVIILVVPAIYFAAFIAPWLYYILLAVGALFVHAYLFTLYKEML